MVIECESVAACHTIAGQQVALVADALVVTVVTVVLVISVVVIYQALVGPYI